MNTIKQAAIFFMMLLIFAMPTDGATEIAGMSLVKIAGLMAFGLTGLLLVMGNNIYVSPSFHSGVLLFVVWAIMSYTWSEMPVPYESAETGGAQQIIKAYIYILMLTLLVFQLTINTEDLSKLYIAFLLGAYWLIYIMVKDYEVTATTVRHEIKNFDANEVCVKLAMVMPLAIYLFMHPRYWLWRLLSIIYIPAAMYTILITGSRTGSIVMSLGLMGFAPILMRSSWMVKLMSLCLVVVSLVTMVQFIPQKTIERIFTTGKEISSGTLNERSVIWSKAYEEWAEKPLQGHGLSAFRRIMNPHNLNYSAHNSVVTVTVEQGIIGTCLYLSVIVITAFSAVRLKGDLKLLMIIMLLITVIGQMSLSLVDRMYVWFSYSLVVLTCFITQRTSTTSDMEVESS